MIGQTIAHYKITEKIGEGGMGEVYRASDTKLNREVALKILPEQFAEDSQRMGRFRREAEVLASLDHPNIGQIYGIEDAGETKALVLQLIEGPTLANRIAEGPIAIDEALAIGLQITHALEAAHEKRIIHRDLKPANVKITHQGRVKVLDFGLAKAAEANPESSPDLTSSPTLSLAVTQAGVILGTAAYMSPEQARGHEADERSDLWAFGVILWEMLTGRRLFKEETVSDTLAAVLKSDIPWDALPWETPVSIRQLLHRCLVRDPHNRLHHAADARIEIQHAIDGDTLKDTAAVMPDRNSLLPWILAAGLLVLSLVLLADLFLQEPVRQEAIKLQILPPEGTIFLPGDGGVTPSPDGRQIVTVVQGTSYNKLAVRTLGSEEYKMLPIGENTLFEPFWSPDGRFIGYFHWDGTLKKIALSGGPPVSLASGTDPRGGTWNADGIVLFAPSAKAPIYRVAAEGGKVEAVTKLNTEKGEIGHWRPHFLPDGRRFLFLALAGDDNSVTPRGRTDFSYSSPHGPGMLLWVGSLDGDPPQPIPGTFEGAVVYSPPGYLLYRRDRTLVTRPFDLATLSWQGEEVALAQGIEFFPQWATPAFAVSKTGILAYHRQQAPPERKLVWRDRKGTVLSEIVIPGAPRNLDLSPDGTRAAIQVTNSSRNEDIWVVDLQSNAQLRLTFGESIEDGPVWSPDSQRIAYMRGERGTYRVLVKAASGAGREEILFEADGFVEPVDWSLDGQFLLLEGIGLWGDLWVLPLAGEKEPVRFLGTPFGEDSGRFSPDGRWIAYASDETNRTEIYIQSWPSGRGKWQISTDGGDDPRWRSDGKEIYYSSAAGRLIARSLEFSEDGSLQLGSPQPLFATDNWGYEPSPDGQQFLIIEPILEGNTQAATLVLNWPALLKEE